MLLAAYPFCNPPLPHQAHWPTRDRPRSLDGDKLSHVTTLGGAETLFQSLAW